MEDDNRIHNAIRPFSSFPFPFIIAFAGGYTARIPHFPYHNTMHHVPAHYEV